MELTYLLGEDGSAYFTKGYVPFDEFMLVLEQDVGPGDSILQNTPEHIWLRTTRDFQENRTVYEEAAPNSRGAFKVTWINS